MGAGGHDEEGHYGDWAGLSERLLAARLEYARIMVWVHYLERMLWWWFYLMKYDTRAGPLNDDDLFTLGNVTS